MAAAYAFFNTLLVFLLHSFGGLVRKCLIYSVQQVSKIFFCLFSENNDYKTKEKQRLLRFPAL